MNRTVLAGRPPAPSHRAGDRSRTQLQSVAIRPQPRPDGSDISAATSSERAVRVALVDDDQLLAGSLHAWSQNHPGLRLVATAPTVDALTIPPESVDVVLLDVLLQDGTDAADNVARLTGLGYRVLVVTVVRDSAVAISTHAAGAHGYLTKDTGPGALVTAVADVAAGKPYYSRELAHAFLTDTRPTRPVLSDQERTVLLHYTAGMTLVAAARAAGIKHTSASTYLERVKRKYRDVGRPANTKLLLADRVREDGLRS